MKQITSRDNPLFKQLKKLTLSSRERHKSGQTLLDGAHLLQSYRATGAEPELLIVTEQGSHNSELVALLSDVAESSLVTMPDAMFAELSPVETPSGILALIPIPPFMPPLQPEFCLLVEDVQDPGNLGSILRSAAAAGVNVAYLSEGCADPWSPKVLRGGMGAHFALSIAEKADLLQTLKVFTGFTGVSVATSLSATKSLYQLDLTGRVVMLVGNEGAGLSAALLSSASEQVRIPMYGNTESLNVAAATAICLFERVRQLSV
ncbi:MAG: RNA methyltransferase [Methylophilales bacterium]|nr:RNA methyltransferase [Methylophilales bacterium]